MSLKTKYRVDQSAAAVLPYDTIYNIEIGGKLFRLSGASLSSDSPSYFTSFFSHPENETKTLTVDRSSEVFAKIATHLQGYAIRPTDEYDLMRLYADASYFNLPKLSKQLAEDFYYVNVGGRSFNFPQSLVKGEGNTPNYFHFAFGTCLRNPYSISELKDLLRPPAMLPIVVDRSASLFADLLDALWTENYKVRDETHREQLLAECRYFRFFALEQKLIAHQIELNPFTNEEEILIMLPDVKKIGLSYDSNDKAIYRRPFVDSKDRTLVLQIDSEELSLLIHTKLSFLSALATGNTLKRLKAFFGPLTKPLCDSEVKEDGTVVEKMRLYVKMENCTFTLNGLETKKNWYEDFFLKDDKQPMVEGDVINVKLLKSQWTIQLQNSKRLWFTGLLADGVLDSASYNRRRGFI
ncbi:hypothetical protein OGAPHI_006991 [Ogataea philodendri]|uniref:Potassium channel tetramerisation-type BTB domain-containing protein n=1 Tax=Ogataea philodendri TaxID=1378263 RepID=A0A9P8NVD6_9ASCO|nr:uncharacterized protein OGAPHI_006991 [Ogataea philodendri]KAH3660405.1 hypothetical protein OGAPHI_006991 [Ogataea philodendri]